MQWPPSCSVPRGHWQFGDDPTMPAGQPVADAGGVTPGVASGAALGAAGVSS